MPVRAPTLHFFSVWLQLQCSYVQVHHRNNITKPAGCSTIQSVKNSATQCRTVQHSTVLYLNNSGSWVSRVSRADSDLQPVWIWGTVVDLTMAPMVVVKAGDTVHSLYRAGTETADGRCWGG